MSSRKMSPHAAKHSSPLEIEAELNRVKQRAKARLGKGIDQRCVEVMLSKLDEQNEKEKARSD